MANVAPALVTSSRNVKSNLVREKLATKGGRENGLPFFVFGIVG